MELRRRARRVGRLFAISTRNQSEALKLARLGLVLTGALLAGGAQFMDTPDTGVAWSRVIGFTGVIVAFWGGFWSFRADRDAPTALEEARRAIEEAQLISANARYVRDEIAAEVSKLKRDHEQIRRLVALTNILREGVERALVSDDDDLHKHLKDMLYAAYRPLLACIRCEAGERWTVTIYQFLGGRLVGAAACTVDRGEEGRPVREWRSGEGFAGLAYARDHEVVLANAQASEVISMINVPQDLLRDGDETRYRSVAAIPIRVAGLTPPWGVVIATSDQVGRFDSGQGEAETTGVQAVRLLAGMVALVVAGGHI